MRNLILISSVFTVCLLACSRDDEKLPSGYLNSKVQQDYELKKNYVLFDSFIDTCNCEFKVISLDKCNNCPDTIYWRLTSTGISPVINVHRYNLSYYTSWRPIYLSNDGLYKYLSFFSSYHTNYYGRTGLTVDIRCYKAGVGYETRRFVFISSPSNICCDYSPGSVPTSATNTKPVLLDSLCGFIVPTSDDSAFDCPAVCTEGGGGN